ncbi:hypothetical protein P692DRAFT_20716135, partial [Suillus brevipes Sb2]
LDINIIRYNEALAKRETGMHDAHEDARLMKFPMAEKLVLDTPCVVVDSGLRIILWYVLKCLSLWDQNDMFTTTRFMGDLLRKSITARQGTSWRTCESNFGPSETPHLTPGCINIAPCWFQQGHEVGPLWA